MKPDEPRTDWLAREIFKAYPHDCPGLKIYVLDCGCLYYRRVFRDGTEDDQIGIYRNPAHGLRGATLIDGLVAKKNDGSTWVKREQPGRNSAPVDGCPVFAVEGYFFVG